MPAYRLRFAVKVLGDGGLKSCDSRRWQSGPHLRVSVALLDRVFEYLDRIDVRVFRLSSSTVPYGTHPDLPQFDYRRQLDEAAVEIAALGSKARALGLRLSTHPGQYTVLNAPVAEVVRKALLDVEQDAALLDALGQGPEAAVVVHVGGAYGDKAAALDRWVRAYGSLSETARARIAVEHDERLFTLEDVLALHARTGVRVVYDHHHHRCNPSDAAVGDALATWRGARPKVHLSSARIDFCETRAPKLDQHADFVSPWDFLDLHAQLREPVDVVLEAKAKDLAVLWLRDALVRVAPAAAAHESYTHDTRGETRWLQSRNTRASKRRSRRSTPTGATSRTSRS